VLRRLNVGKMFSGGELLVAVTPRSRKTVYSNMELRRNYGQNRAFINCLVIIATDEEMRFSRARSPSVLHA